MTNHLLGLVNVELLLFSHTTTCYMTAVISGDGGFLRFFALSEGMNLDTLYTKKMHEVSMRNS